MAYSNGKRMSRSIFIVLVLSYVLLKIAVYAGVQLPEVVLNYWADLICIPIFLFLSEGFMARLYPSRFDRISLAHILSMVVIMSVCFELLLPIYSQAYTADGVDVLMYVIGGALYYAATVKRRSPLLSD